MQPFVRHRDSHRRRSRETPVTFATHRVLDREVEAHLRGGRVAPMLFGWLARLCLGGLVVNMGQERMAGQKYFSIDHFALT